jgi:predicted dehydrogenase
MKRIGIVGSDNSHAIAYSKLVNRDRIVGDNAAVIGIWGQEAERTREVAEAGAITKIYDAFEAMIPDVDVVFVVDRHGDLHVEHAIPFLKAGIPTYVDKPLAISLSDARAIIDAANANGTFLTSMSSLRITPDTARLAEQAGSIGEIRAAQFSGPCDFASVYGGPFFYATHVAEIALRLLGNGIESLTAARTGQTVVIDAAWKGDVQATFTYLGDTAYHFGATLFGKDGVASGAIGANEEGYAAIVTQVLEAIDAGKRPLSEDQMLTPIAIVHAIQRSLEQSGARISIADILSA